MNFLLSVFLAATSMFHAELKSAMPAQNSTLDKSPTMVMLTFTEDVNVKVSTLSVMKSDSSVNEKLTVKPGNDKATFMGTVTKTLAAGKYMVKWHTASADDGHVTSGSYWFTVK